MISSFGIQTWVELNAGQRCFGAQLVRNQEVCEPISFKVKEMGAVGQGKVRYVGGWAIRKVLEKSRRYELQHHSN